MDILSRLKELPPETDYQSLMALLQGYSHPRRKLKELQTKEYLVRLKKGHYLITQKATDKVYSRSIAANLLYGPSYLSLQYALGVYELIPERVAELTSVTTQKNKIYHTPIGRFSYQHLHHTLYPLGISIRREEDGRQYLIARPEKALLDLFCLDFRSAARSSKLDLTQALEDDLRIDREKLSGLSCPTFLGNVRQYYRNRPWCKLLIDHLLEKK